MFTPSKHDDDLLLLKKNDAQSGTYAVNEKVLCRSCDSYECSKVSIPFVLRYLTNELAAMNIRLQFHLDRPQAL